MYKVKAKKENISAAVEYIENYFLQQGCERKRSVKTAILAEEIMVQMISLAEENAEIAISFSGKKNHTKVQLKCRGEKLDQARAESLNKLMDTDVDGEDYDEEQRAIISDLILRSFSSNIHAKYVQGLNVVTLQLPKEKSTGSMTGIWFLLAGLVAGFLLKVALPSAATDFLSDNIFSVISQIFFNGMGIVVAPLVFFSVAESVSGFSDMKAFGRIGAKVMGSYCGTTLIAVLLGYLCVTVFQPGDMSLLPIVKKMCYAADTTASVDIAISLKDSLLGMVPENFFMPFVQANMIQVIVLSILFGIASRSIGEYSEIVQRFIKAGNALFSKMTSYISNILPLTVFCLMANLTMTMDGEVFGLILRIVLTASVAFFSMLCVYSLLLLCIGRVNPLSFWKNHKDAMAVAFTTCSSSATMPTSMKCLERFGVSSKIYSFSIPLGATVNMDGASISYVVMVLTMVRIFGIQLSSPALVAFFLSVLLLSVGTPCVAGAGVACVMLLLAQVGVSPAAIAFLMPINSLIEFMDTVVNVSGDATVTTIVARSEKLLNRD